MNLERTMTRPFVRAGIVGVLVIAMSIVLLFIFPAKAPRLPDGFFTPIVAFEFIETKAEVFQMFVATNGQTRQAMVDAMDLGNRLDYIYMCLYSFFLLLFSLKCGQISGKKYFYISAAMAIMVLLGDAFENVQLLEITAGIESGDFEVQLGRLHMFTWIKWGGIAAIFLVLTPWFMKGGMFSKVIGVIGGVCFLLGVVSFMHRSVITEIFGLSVAVMFMLMIIYCFTFKFDGLVKGPSAAQP